MKKLADKTMYHHFFDEADRKLADMMSAMSFMDSEIQVIRDDTITKISLEEPTNESGFLHETAIIEYHDVLYAAWYRCLVTELKDYTPICGKRSYDKGKTWTDTEVWVEPPQEDIMLCPPVFGIDDDKLYMFVNEMVAPDCIHSLNLYVLNAETNQFDLVFKRPIPLKLNTNVVTLPNGKLMLPGRFGELDQFANVPAAIISDSGKIDAEWRLVKIAENAYLADGEKFIHPEMTVLCENDILYMFCRNDLRHVPLVYISKDFGDTWSEAYSHDMPFINSKMYGGQLKDGRFYMVCNIDIFPRSELGIYISKKNELCFEKYVVLSEKENPCFEGVTACHYPSVVECDNKLYVIATHNYHDWFLRGAVLYTVDLENI